MDLRAGESAGFVPTGADAVTAAKIRLATHRAAAGAACAPQHAGGALVGPEGVVPNSQVLSAQKRRPHSQVLAWKGAPTRRCSAYRPARLRSPPNRELRSLRGRRRAHGTHGSPERAAPHTSSAPPPIRSQALRTRRTAPDHGEAKPRTDIGGGRPAVKSKIAMATKSEGKQDDRDVPGAFSRWAGGGTPLSLLPLSPSLGPRRYRRCCGGTWPYPWGACACCACCAWGGAGV